MTDVLYQELEPGTWAFVASGRDPRDTHERVMLWAIGASSRGGAATSWIAVIPDGDVHEDARANYNFVAILGGQTYPGAVGG